MSDALRFEVNTEGFKAQLAELREALSPKRQNMLIDQVALEARTMLVNATPKRTGNTQDAWRIEKPADGVREVVNSSKVASMLEYGTPRANPGALIFPKGDFLYFENKDGNLIRKRSVHGMLPRHYIKKTMPAITQMFMDKVKDLAERLASRG
jgi:hypothetical protein